MFGALTPHWNEQNECRSKKRRKKRTPSALTTTLGGRAAVQVSLGARVLISAVRGSDI